jgi:hypothetical protein
MRSTLRAVRKLFSRKPAAIQKSTNGHDHHAVAGAHKVGLKPEGEWRKRNFITSVWLPSLFKIRVGSETRPFFPHLNDAEVGVTWIGHASFLLQFHGCNVLIDPNWANWLKVVKRLKRPGVEISHLPNYRLCARDTCALRSSRSPHSAQGSHRSADRGAI